MCLDLPSTSADMTFPRADSERLILVASLNLSPVAPKNERSIWPLETNLDRFWINREIVSITLRNRKIEKLLRAVRCVAMLVNVSARIITDFADLSSFNGV